MGGTPPRYTGDPPAFKKPQWRSKDPKEDAKVQEWEQSKVRKAQQKGYIGPSTRPIDSLMSFFSVPKVTVCMTRKLGWRKFWISGWGTMGQAVV
jgi:hypothetical protein